MRFQRASADDIQLVFDLITRSDIAEYGEPDSELSDLRDEWGKMDLSRDIWLVKGDGAMVLGYGAVVPEMDDVRFDVYVDPDQADTGTAADLLSRCEKRVQGLVDKTEVIGRTYLAHVNLQIKELFTEAGFEYVKSYYQFHIDLHTNLDDPIWPESVSMRTAVAGDDDERIYQAVQTAFERSKDQAPTYKQWRTHMIRPDIYDPELWFLVEVNGEIVGMSLGVKYETEGWIRQLGVIPTWRRKGIATALLRLSFLKFHERGYDRVGLGMEAKNEKALSLYRRVGMSVRRQYDEYCKVYTP